MARVILSSCVFRYPMGGMRAWVLQYLVGFQRLGHEVTYVEKAAEPNSCFDPTRDQMGDDCGYGLRAVAELWSRFALGERWHFVDVAGQRYGLSQDRVDAEFDSADLFIDMGGDHSWHADAERARLRAYIDCEPAFTQMRWEARLEAGKPLPAYDFYYTCGRNIGTQNCSAPTAGKPWRPHVEPVVPDLFPVTPVAPGAPFTTVMTWQSFRPYLYQGQSYGQKDREFEKFESLPRRTSVPLEVAVSGSKVPWDRLAQAGWRVRNANDTASSRPAAAGSAIATPCIWPVAAPWSWRIQGGQSTCPLARDCLRCVRSRKPPLPSRRSSATTLATRAGRASWPASSSRPARCSAGS